MKADLAPAWRRRAAIFWAARSPREQGILRLAAIVLGLAIAGQLLWQLEDARRRQLRQLPELAAQATQLAALAAAWQGLAATPVAPVDAAALRSVVQTRLGELGPDIAAHWEDDGRLTLRGSTGLAGWLRWTAAVHEEHRLRLESCRVTGSGATLQIEASYRAAGRPS
ncbi:type II secretion system protein GspM [Azonexus sp.]|uniref:type II secretion system protein GspM n=1 Tax=Azonexus sp. TaxID=1872668 RepID=UPI0035ADFBD0